MISARLRPKVRRRSTNELKLIVLDPAINISRFSISIPGSNWEASHRHLLIVHARNASFQTPNFHRAFPGLCCITFPAFRLDPDLDSSSCLVFFPTHAFLIPNDGAIVFVLVVFVLFAFPLSTVFSYSWRSLHYSQSFCRVWRPPVYHPDLFPFGNSRGSTSVTWPTPYWDKQDKWDKHGKHCILYHYCFCLFVFARSFFAFFRCWLGVGLGILCWSMWLRVVFSFVSGLRCGSFGTLIIWLGWVGCTILDYYLWYCNV